MDHHLRLYGSESGKLLTHSMEIDNALENITPGAPDIWTQVYHAIREEWALTAEDVVYRKTTLSLRGLDTLEIRRVISATLESAAGAETPPPEASSRFIPHPALLPLREGKIRFVRSSR